MTASKPTLSLLFFVLTMSSPPISSAAARRPCPGGSCPSPPSLEDARFFPHRRPLAVPLAGRRASHPPATARRPLHRETLTASRVADLLDAGCIVGSPMRTIAAYSVSDDQAHIEVINGVEHDDAVRGLCCHDKIAFIAEVDFEGVKELDFSLPPSLQWWPPLKMGCLSVTRWRRLHAAKESMGDIWLCVQFLSGYDESYMVLGVQML